MTQPELFNYQKDGMIYSISPAIRFNGPDYDPKHDNIRLTKQILGVFNAMKDGEWRTLGEIENLTAYPQASISAQLRHLRKERFGAHIVNKQIRGERKDGLYEYQLIINSKK